MSTLHDTPSANRIHIGFFGKCNSGKSTLINRLANQPVSIVSETPGTTTDPVNKAIEIPEIGPCILIDTAGFDDATPLGTMRITKTKQILEKTDIAVYVISAADDLIDINWLRRFRDLNIPLIFAVTKTDLYVREQEAEDPAAEIRELFKDDPVVAIGINDPSGISELIGVLQRISSVLTNEPTILGNLVSDGDSVMLVMPQDSEAPKGRLILPQVQTLRELLDRHCVVTSVAPEEMTAALTNMIHPPKLIITDSQAFEQVYANKPKESSLTGFSVLFAAQKGDIAYYVRSCEAFKALTYDSHVLIAECCTHAPKDEDIGRVKIPMMLRRKFGEKLRIDVVSGTDFPEDLSRYDLIIQCGGCMFNRRHVLSRIRRAREQAVPMTNYGIAIAYLKGILDRVVIPEELRGDY